MWGLETKIEYKRWTTEWYEMVLANMLLKTGPPTMEEALVMMMALISPSQREVSQTELLRRREKVLVFRIHLERAALHPEIALFIFLGQIG